MASEKARKAEAKANASSGLISIKIGSESSGAVKKGGFKKAGFKSAFAPAESDTPREPDETKDSADTTKLGVEAKVPGYVGEEIESETEDEGYEMYNPRHPTD